MLALVIDMLGGPLFYDRLLALLGQTVPSDLAALVCYSRSGPPDMILPRVEPSLAMRSYTEEFYVYDPFHLHWTQTGQTGVLHLQALAPLILGTRYAREFLAEMRIHDEIAVFLPPLGEAAPTLILDRAAAPFTAAEVARITALYPLLAALQRRHLEFIVLTGGDFGLSPAKEIRALRIVDQTGRAIYATEPWRHVEAQATGGLAVLLERLGNTGPCQASIGEGRALRRTQLPPDFGAVPGGPTCLVAAGQAWQAVTEALPMPGEDM